MRIKLYKTYNLVKDIFAKPKLHFYFGKWINDPTLPVWRRGPIIYLFKNRDKKAYQIKSMHYVKTGSKTCTRDDGTEYQIPVYNESTHKLPHGIKNWDYVWRSDIRKKLKKWHLSWIKPTIQLPIWLSFHIFNYDVMWKTKYDDFRYEFPPQFTIVFFGLSFSWWLTSPKSDKDDYGCDDFYWETILDYLYAYNKDFVKTIKSKGYMTRYSKDDVSYFWTVRPEYVNQKYKKQYLQTITELIKGKNIQIN